MVAILERVDEAAELLLLDKELDVLFDPNLTKYQVNWRLWCAQNYGAEYNVRPRIHTGIVHMEGESPQEFHRRYHRETMRIYRERKRQARQPNATPPKAPVTDTTSKYRGVCLDKRAQKWRARLWVNRERVYLGLYPTQEAAAQAREDAIASLIDQLTAQRQAA